MKNIILKTAAIIVIPILISFAIHDFYTSMTKVDYNIASSTVQFSTKIDVEHMENALGEKTSSSNFDSKLARYFANHVKVKINDAPQSLVYANKKIAGEVVWVYYNIPNVKEVNSIEINNTLLFEKYSEQLNYVNYNVNSKRVSMIAKKGNSSAKKIF